MKKAKKTYIIKETCFYEVEAASEEEAEEIFVQTEDINTLFTHCEDREAYQK